MPSDLVLTPDDLDILIKVRAICGHGPSVLPSSGAAIPPPELVGNCESLVERGYLMRLALRNNAGRGYRLTEKGAKVVPADAETEVCLPARQGGKGQ